MRKRFSAVQWAAWFEEFDGAGVTVAEFCRQIDVGENSFYNWKRKLRRRDAGEERFVPVVIQPTGQVAIDLPCGAVVRVDNQVHALRPVLEALIQIPGEHS